MIDNSLFAIEVKREALTFITGTDIQIYMGGGGGGGFKRGRV